MTILRLDPVAGQDVDRAAALAAEIVFHRRREGCFAEVASDYLAVVVRALALAGVEAREARIDLTPPRDHIPAIGADLLPSPDGLLVSDVVRVRRLPLGPATAEVLRRRCAFFFPPSAAAQARCRRLLRGEDALLGWQRQAWVERGRIRAVRSRASMRPVVFDVGALDRRELRGRALVSDGALAKWAFG